MTADGQKNDVTMMSSPSRPITSLQWRLFSCSPPITKCAVCLRLPLLLILFRQRFMFRSAFTSLLAFIFRFSWLFCFAHPFFVLAAVCLALYCRLCIFLSIHYFYCLSDKNVRSFITLLSGISCCLSYCFVFNLHMLFYCLSDQNCFALLSSD